MFLAFCILGIHACLGFRNSCFGFISVVVTPSVFPHTLKNIVQFALDNVRTIVLLSSSWNKKGVLVFGHRALVAEFWSLNLSK